MTPIGAGADLGQVVSENTMNDPIDHISDDDLERYARHLVLPEIGVTGQIAIGQTCVAIIGCGGLGANLALALAQAGIGTIELYDPDCVELSNLHRQPFKMNQVGQAKAQALADLCQERNSQVIIKPVQARFNDSSAPIWADCTDTDDSRRDIDARRHVQTALVFGSVLGMDSQITLFEPGVLGFSNLFPSLPSTGLQMTCAEQGVLGPLANLAAQIMAAEILKLAQGQASSLNDKFLMIDARDWRQMQIARDTKA